MFSPFGTLCLTDSSGGSTGSFYTLLLFTILYLSLSSTIPRCPNVVLGAFMTVAFLLSASWNLVRVVKFGRDPAVEIFGMSTVAVRNSLLM